MTDSRRFDPTALLYIRTRGRSDKRPMDKWGGYDTDLADREHVYTHDEVEESDEDHWAVVDAVDGDHMTVSTLVFDLDIHKAPEDFDEDRVSVPDNTLLVKSQSGGFHVYFKVVNCDPGEFQESDFEMTQAPGWDVDIRGSAVSHHVVAPNSVPGVETPYEVVNDYRISTVTDPADAASRIQLDGEPLLEFNPDQSYNGGIEIDRDVEPPEDMPTCYHRGLQMRAANPEDDEGTNTHKVNVLTALCGLAAGYEVDTMVDHFVDEYAPGDNADTDKTEYQLKHLARNLDNGSYSPPALSTLRDYGILDESESCDCSIAYHGTAGSEMSGGEVADAGSDGPLEVTAEDPFGELHYSEKVGGYYYVFEKTDREGERYYEQQRVTNFRLETLEFLDTDEGELMNLRVVPVGSDEEPYEVSVEPTVFNETRAFKEEVVRGRTTRYEPGKMGQQALNDLRETVGRQDAPERAAVDHLGPATDRLDEVVTPAGVLGADGWVDDPKHRYYAKASADSGDESIVGEKWALSPEDHTDVDEAEVRKTLEMLPKARLPDRALATLGWFYSAVAKPLIHDEEGEFNHLHVRGKTESGKTSYLQTLYRAFGMGGTPWGASSTPFTLEQLHVGSRGVPVWIDEYKPSQMHNRNVDRLHDYLRLATREGTWTKGQPDQSHLMFKMQSPVVLSGEQQVGEPAVRRRMLQVSLSERATDTLEHRRAYSELAGEPYEGADGTTKTPSGVALEDHALAYYQFLAGRDASLLRDVWRASRTRTADILDELGMKLEDSEFQGAQTVVFGYRLYSRFAATMGVDETALPGDDALRDAIRHLAENVGANGQRREHGDEFLELVAQAANAGYIHSEDEYDEGDAGSADYRVYSPSATVDEAIAIHMQSVYPEVKRYARDYNLEDDYNLLQKSDYDDEFADLAESDDTHVVSNSHNVRIAGNPLKCLLLEARDTHRRLGRDFQLSAFGMENVDVEVPDEEGGDGDDPDGGNSPEASKGPDTVPLADLETVYNGPGSVSVQVTVTDTLEPKPWLEAEGTLEDTLGDTMDYQARGDPNPLPADAEGGEYIIHNARLTSGEYGEPILEFRPDTEFVPVGNTASKQQSVTEPVADGGAETEDDARADADLESPKEMVERTVADAHKDAFATGELVQKATDRFEDLTPPEADDAIQALREAGRLAERSGTDGKLELRAT